MRGTEIMSTGRDFEQHFKRLDLMAKVGKSARDRAGEASEALQRSAVTVLGGKRSGRQYRIPGSKRKYIASAPGEAPGQKSRVFRRSWYRDVKGLNPGIDTQESDIARMMSKGTKRTTKSGTFYMKRRPFVRKIQRRSGRALRRIYRRPYLK